MRKIVFTILVSALFAPALAQAEDASEMDVAQDIGSVLAWLEANAALIATVDSRVAEVAPLIQAPSPGVDVVQIVREQVKGIFLESAFAGKTPQEQLAVCQREANPDSPRWKNPGMPQVPMALAALYDWKVQHGSRR